MIKLPPSGIAKVSYLFMNKPYYHKLTAKLLVPTAISSVYHTELLLEGNGIEIIPSAIYEMNLNVRILPYLVLKKHRADNRSI